MEYIIKRVSFTDLSRNPMEMPEQPKILLVDDREENLFVLKKILEDDPLDIYTAGSGSEALKLTLEHEFFLIVLDVQMPDMDGFETAEILQNDKDTKQIPIIFVTAIDKEEKRVFKGYQSGAVDYLFKPVDAHILRSKVRVFVDLFNQKAELNQNRELLKNSNARLELMVEERTKELVAAKEEAESASQLKSEFLANISHEFLTPMHHILSFSQIGLDKAEKKSDDTFFSYFKKINQSGHRTLHLLNDLLILAKLQAKTVQLSWMRYNLVTLFDSCVHSFKDQLSQKNIEITVLSTDSETVVECDIQQIYAVIEKLLENSIKYSSHNAKITVSFEPSEQADQKAALKCAIADTGVGIPEEEIEHIFNSFTQSSRTKTGAGGIGLGLPICKEIINLHGGDIWVETITGEEGAVICFTLPYKHKENSTD